MPPWTGERAYTLGKLGDTAAAPAVVRCSSVTRDQGLLYKSLAMAYVGLGDTARSLTALEKPDAAQEAWPLFHRRRDAMWTRCGGAPMGRRRTSVGLETMPHVPP